MEIFIDLPSESKRFRMTLVAISDPISLVDCDITSSLRLAFVQGSSRGHPSAGLIHSHSHHAIAVQQITKGFTLLGGHILDGGQQSGHVTGWAGFVLGRAGSVPRFSGT